MVQANEPCHCTTMIVGTITNAPLPAASSESLTACLPGLLELRLSGGSELKPEEKRGRYI
jgi:hypothetical protein